MKIKTLFLAIMYSCSLTSGRTEVIAKFTNKDEAQQLIKQLTVDLDVCTRPSYFKERPQA